MVNLLMRFYEVDDGDIKIDGIFTRDLSRENVHYLFSMVLQDTRLFVGVNQENIVYSKRTSAIKKPFRHVKRWESIILFGSFPKESGQSPTIKRIFRIVKNNLIQSHAQ